MSCGIVRLGRKIHRDDSRFWFTGQLRAAVERLTADKDKRIRQAPSQCLEVKFVHPHDAGGH